MFHFNDKTMIAVISVLLLVCAGNTRLAMGEDSPLAKSGTEPGQRVTMKVDGLELAFRWCPSGSFTMGSPINEPNRMPDPWEYPHKVTLTSGFWMLETEVTQNLFQHIMGKNPSYWKGGDRPVEMIGMPTCVNFCNLFSRKTGLTAKLPTEAQWEYACRAGTTTAFSFGNIMNEKDMQCRGKAISSERQIQGTKSVRSFKPNAWGLYDMHGNVAEWVADPFDPEYYSVSPAVDPSGPEKDANLTLRGGGWSSTPDCCRSATRNLDVKPYSCSSSYGFRFIIVPKHLSK